MGDQAFQAQDMKPGRSLSSTLAAALLALAAATYVVNAMDRIVFATLLPAVTREYGFSLVQGGLLTTVFALGIGVSGVPCGYLLDFSSRKTVAVVGVLIYSVCTILTCIAAGFADMSVYRAVSGVGEGFQNAALFAACGTYYWRNRSFVLGLLNVAFGLGSFLGPRLGALLLAQSSSWRVPLVFYGVLGLLGALLVQLLMPRQFTEQTVAPDAALQNARLPATLVNRNTMILAITSVGIGLAGFGYLGLYPTFLTQQLHYSISEAASAASMFGVGALTGPLCGYLGDRIDQKSITLVGLIVLATAGYCIFNVTDSLSWQKALSFVEGSAWSGFLFINNYSLMQRSVRAEMTGRASGLVVTCVYVPAAFAGYLFAALKNASGWGTAATLLLSAQLAIPLVAMLFFDTKRIHRLR